MKNIIKLNTIAKCNSCSTNGFFCYNLNGGDYTTCPCCKKGDFMATQHNTEIYNLYFNNDNYNNAEDSKFDEYSFCDSCKIVYKVGCIHAENGCTSSCYNGHFISKWKYKDEIYDGMPQFDDVAEWYNEFENIQVLNLICINNGLHCEKGFYPKITNPQCYEYCDLI